MRGDVTAEHTAQELQKTKIFYRAICCHFLLQFCSEKRKLTKKQNSRQHLIRWLIEHSKSQVIIHSSRVFFFFFFFWLYLICSTIDVSDEITMQYYLHHYRTKIQQPSLYCPHFFHVQISAAVSTGFGGPKRKSYISKEHRNQLLFSENLSLLN